MFFLLAGHKLASLYACWPSVLVVGSSGLQASGHVCKCFGAYIDMPGWLFSARVRTCIGRSSTCTPLCRRIHKICSAKDGDLNRRSLLPYIDSY